MMPCSTETILKFKVVLMFLVHINGIIEFLGIENIFIELEITTLASIGAEILLKICLQQCFGGHFEFLTIKFFPQGWVWWGFFVWSFSGSTWMI